MTRPLPKFIAEEFCEVETCNRRVTSDQWCIVHFTKFTRSGDPLRNKLPYGSKNAPGSLAERFSHMFVVCPETGCWLWLGNVNSVGYGLFQTTTRKDGKRVPKPARRFAWEHFVGPIPPLTQLKHAEFDEKACVNPDHLLLGTTRGILERHSRANGNKSVALRIRKREGTAPLR